jgi:transcriptional regulator
LGRTSSRIRTLVERSERPRTIPNDPNDSNDPNDPNDPNDLAQYLLLLMDNRTMDEVPYGALDLMVLKTLDGLGPQHGYGIARRIEQIAEGTLSLNQGTIYPALLRLEQKGWITSDWGMSENNRRARFYSITRAGRKQLAVEADLWSRTVAMMSRLLEGQS